MRYQSFGQTNAKQRLHCDSIESSLTIHPSPFNTIKSAMNGSNSHSQPPLFILSIKPSTMYSYSQSNIPIITLYIPLKENNPKTDATKSPHFGKSRKTKKRWKIDAMSEKESPTVQNELDLDSLVNQLSASTEYNDLRQKMNKIEKSKVPLSPLPNHPIDEGVRRIAQTTA